MAYRATPQSTTGYSPFYLLHGREMVLPNEGDLKAKISHDIQDVDQVKRLENLKSSLKKAYEEDRLHNQKAHHKNKAYYDKKAKERKFDVNDKVYLFCPARKPGRCHKFRSFWQGPFIVVQKLSGLNYKIVNKQGKEFVVHINRLKKSYDQTPWSFENTRHPRNKTRLLDTETLDGDVVIQSRPIVTSEERETQAVEAHALEEERLQLDQDPQVHENIGTPVPDGDRRQIPDSSIQDPDYKPSNSTRSRRELATTPIAPPVTRRCARLQLQENPPV